MLCRSSTEDWSTLNIGPVPTALTNEPHRPGNLVLVRNVVCFADSSAIGDMEALNVRLLMLLRDFDREQLQGQKPNQHLEDWLKEEQVEGPDPTLENQNSIRYAIKRLFRTRDCLTMSPPSGSTTNVAGRKLDQDAEFMEVRSA